MSQLTKTLLFASLQIFILTIMVLPVYAQGDAWSTPVLLSNEEMAIAPVLLCPVDGSVHVFWGTDVSQQDGTLAAIFHRQRLGDIWNEPTDIIALPRPRTADLDVLLATDGQVHLVWVSDEIYYSQAPLTCVSSPRCWSAPQQLSEGLAVTPDIEAAPDGSLHVIYVDTYISPFVQHAWSDDGGKSWKQGPPVSRPSGSAYAVNARLVIDQEGRLHTAWSESVEPFPPAGIYYAYSDDGGLSWSAPRPIAEGGYSWPSLGLDPNGGLHLFYTGTGLWAGKYHTFSRDRGSTWAPPQRAWSMWPGVAGFWGFASFVETNDALHVLAAWGVCL